MVEVKKKKNETFDALLRRFHDGGQNETQRHDSALRRVNKGAEYAYLTKTGQLKEDPKKKKYGRR